MTSKPFKIPLAGSYNTRVSATNILLGPDSGIVGIGVVGTMIVGKGGQATTKDQRFINCFTERVINSFTGKTTLYLVKRPGFASSLTPQAGSIGNAILLWTGAAGKIISAFGATNSSIYDSSTRLVTNNGDTTVITGKARSITETSISDTATLFIASNDSTGWYYQPAGTVTKIADGDYPGNAGLTTVGGFAHMDGYAFIMTSTGKIYNSDVNSLTSWAATSFISANSYPDAGIAAVRKGDKIMAFGTESIQFFYNAGNAAGSPLSRVEPMTLRVGCVGSDAITQVKDDIFWCGSSPQGGLSVYHYSGTSFNRISTPEIESILLLAGASNISLTSVMFYGRYFVIVMASNVTFLYCLEEKEWTELQGAGPLWYKCAGLSDGSPQATYAISKTSTSGKVFIVNPASYTFQDNGMGYQAIIQTSLIGESNTKTFWDEVEIVGDRQTSASSLSISYNDNDYAPADYVVLGTVDLSDARPRLQRAGTSYRRSWVLTHSANTPLRIEALAGRTSKATQ